MKRHEVLLLAPAEDHENVDDVFNEKMVDNLFCLMILLMLSATPWLKMIVPSRIRSKIYLRKGLTRNHGIMLLKVIAVKVLSSSSKYNL